MDDLHEDFRGALEAYLEKSGGISLEDFVHMLGALTVEIVESSAPEGEDISAALLDLGGLYIQSLAFVREAESDEDTVLSSDPPSCGDSVN